MTTKDTLQILDSGYPPLTALTINNYSMPTTAGTTGQFLKSNGANAQLSWASGTPGGVTSISNTDGNVSITGSSSVVINLDTSVTVDNITTTALTAGTTHISGYAMPTTAGTNGQVLTTNGTNTAAWSTLPSGGVSNVINTDSNLVITGTTTKTINMASDLTLAGNLNLNGGSDHAMVSIGLNAGNGALLSDGVALGAYALGRLANTANTYNIGVGSESLANATTGCVANVGVGTSTLVNVNTNATYNTAVGTNAGNTLNSGTSNNLMLGADAQPANINGNNQIQLGDGNVNYMRVGEGSNLMMTLTPTQLSLPNFKNPFNTQPASNGYVLSCTTAGVLSWIDPMAGSIIVGSGSTNLVDNAANVLGTINYTWKGFVNGPITLVLQASGNYTTVLSPTLYFECTIPGLTTTIINANCPGLNLSAITVGSTTYASTYITYSTNVFRFELVDLSTGLNISPVVSSVISLFLGDNIVFSIL